MRLAPLALLFLAAASAQTGAVAGTVVDGAGAPLPGASVYLSGTTFGDAADAEGRFRIGAVPPGAYRLVASMVGYEAATEDIEVGPGQTVTASLALDRGLRTVGFVRVEAPADLDWRERLGRFEEAFLGESSLADSARIVNPEVLEFREGGGALQATAAKPLVVENRALGYRLTYDLRRFALTDGEVRYDGDERFEPLAPASNAEAARWAAARVEAYRGSLRHLLRALTAGTSEDEGFQLVLDESASATINTDAFGRSQSARPVAASTVFERAGRGGTLAFGGRLTVRYPEPEDPAYLTSRWFAGTRADAYTEQRSTLELRGGAVAVDPRGTPADPLAVVTRGYLGFERVADLLPADYHLAPRAR